jgi:hypothetical protein
MKQEKKIMQGVAAPLPAARTAMPAPAPTPAPASAPVPVPSPPPATPAPRPGDGASPPSVPGATQADGYRILDSAHPQPDASASPSGGGRPPPPALYECTTRDRDSYVSEDADPPPRCVPLRTVGLDGNPNTGAGQACEVQRDTCARVPDGALCTAWRRRLGETEVAWRFGKPENADRNRAEFDRVQKILDASDCAQKP